MLNKREIIKQVMVDTELPGDSGSKAGREENFKAMSEHPDGKMILEAYEKMLDQYAEQESVAFVLWKEQNRNKYSGNDADLYKNHFKPTRP